MEAAAEYVERASPVIESLPAHPEEEKFFVGLRLAEGVRPSAEEWRHFEAPISRFLGEGLLEKSGGTLRLTDRGVLFSNEVFQEFLTT